MAALAGCTTIRESRGGPGQRLDPWENWNRKVFNFNEDVDKAVLKPVATVYSDVVPQPVRRGVSNFFSNFADAWSAINNMLQGKFEAGFEDATRVGANTLFGLFGILDVASEMGLEHHYEDFGQTLGRYGVGAGAYVVLPILGPSTVRDAAAQPLDRLASPPAFFDGTKTQIGFTCCRSSTPAPACSARRVSSTTSRSTSTPSFATPTCSGGAASSSTATRPRRRQAPEEAASAAAGAAAGNVAPPASATPASAPAPAGAASARSRRPASAPALTLAERRL